jgi:hypothetical protein
MTKKFGKLVLFAIFLVIIILGMIFKGNAVEGIDNSEKTWSTVTNAASPGKNIVTATATKNEKGSWNINESSLNVDNNTVIIPKGTGCQTACSTFIPNCKGFMFYIKDDDKGNSASCEFKSSLSNKMNFSKAVLNSME